MRIMWRMRAVTIGRLSRRAYMSCEHPSSLDLGSKRQSVRAHYVVNVLLTGRPEPRDFWKRPHGDEHGPTCARSANGTRAFLCVGREKFP